MSWNPVVNFLNVVKVEFINKYGYAKLYTYEPYNNVIDYWIDSLNNSVYTEILSMLQVNQYKDSVLIRYANYDILYSQLDDVTDFDLWDKYDGLLKECRTIVVNYRTLNIELCSFKKFFNIDEQEECSKNNIIQMINKAKSVEISDKLDGSMQIASYVDNKIMMCGSQAINPELSWRLQDGMSMLQNTENTGIRNYIINHPYLSFIFEYISLKDAHIVKYSKEQEGLYLIGVRNKLTGEQYSYKEVMSIASFCNCKTTKLFDKTLDNLYDDAKKYKSDEKEGYVLNIDKYFVKLKTDDHVYMHKIFSKLSSINMIIHSIADNTFDDLISKVPLAYKENTINTSKEIYYFISNMQKCVEYYYDLAPKNTQKDFMIWVNNNVHKNFRAFVKNMFFGQDINYIKSHNGRYKKYDEIQQYNNLCLTVLTEEGVIK